MENYVNQLLKDADLSVVTKKHVRMKYREHVGRDLLPEEKSKINDMVYAFVKELSVAAQQQEIELVTPEKIPVSKEESPGNKENKQSNQKSTTFILKGQVVDRTELYKSNSKKHQEHSLNEKQAGDGIKKKQDSPGETKPDKSTFSKQKAAAAKLKINEVMTAVLGPDKDESSSEVSSVSSLTDTSLSEEEEEPETGEHINEALEKLKAAREKKIQMSIEKKNKTEKKQKAKSKIKAKRSLVMDDSKLKDKKTSKTGNDTEDPILISDLGSADSDVLKRLSGGDLKRNDTGKGKTSKGIVKDSQKLNSDSGELKLTKTPESYSKCKSWIADKKFIDSSEKKKKLVKRKRKKIGDESESDSDEEVSVKKSLLQRKDLKQKKTILQNKKKNKVVVETDSEDETLDKIAARNNSGAKSVNDKLDKSIKEKQGDSSRTNSKEINSDSDVSTGDTPLARKKKENKVDSNSECRTGDTPLVKKRNFKNSAVSDSDSESGSGDAPLDKKKLRKLNSRKENILDKGKETSKKSNDVDDDEKGNIPELPDLSSGDMPLAQVKKNIKTKSESVIRKKTSVEKKTKAKKSLGYDSNESSEEAPLTQKQEKDKTPDVESVKSTKRKRKLSEALGTGDTPLVSKSKKQKMDEICMIDKSDSELSDVSTGDTPLVKKRFRLRSKTMHLQRSSEKRSSEKIEEDNEEIETSENKKGKKELPCVTLGESENTEDFQRKAENCDTTTDNDSPVKMVKGSRKAKKKLESSSDEESPVKKSLKKKKANKKQVPSDDVVNGASSQSDDTSLKVSDNSDVDSDDSDDIPLAQMKHTVKTNLSDLSSDSEDDIPLSKTKAAQSKATTSSQDMNKKEENGPLSDIAYLRLLRQICRECQMFVRNDRELAGCNTDKEKIEKLEQMLRDVGMKGKPTMRKAEEVKLMKEAKELSADNIISSETGRVMRKVKSIWARRTISPVKPAKSKEVNPFAGLKDIVDSEGTESG